MNGAYVSLRFQSWAVEVLRNRDPSLCRRPFVIASGYNSDSVVLHASKEAEDIGIHEGMELFRVYFIYPGIPVRCVPESVYAEERKRISSLAEGYTPDSEWIADDCFVLDMRSVSRLFKGRKVSDVAGEIGERTGLRPGIGISFVRGVSAAASALAQPGSIISLATGCEYEFLNSLKIQTLPFLDSDSVKRFYGFNVNLIREVFSLSDEMLEGIAGLSKQEFAELVRENTGLRGAGEGSDMGFVKKAVFEHPEYRTPFLVKRVARMMHEAYLDISEAGQRPEQMEMVLVYSDGREYTGTGIPQESVGYAGLRKDGVDLFMSIHKRRVALSCVRIGFTCSARESEVLSLFAPDVSYKDMEKALARVRERFGNRVCGFAG
ncbi:MAG: hypothetical protein ACOCSE_00690 [Chitinivibrionales bacterium]